ncbi:DUF4876 domain-containing protein [Labilibaculum sp.]|uniref:DUF4876 domain-containing protein n=1 Tax=Labilibaculum sp. TaxID=2060723 RepID=UPI003569F4EB
MNHKKFTSWGLFSLLALSFPFTSCNDDSEVSLANLSVSVSASDDFSAVATSDLYVYLENTTDNSKDSVLTDASGMAYFYDIAPGTYSLSSYITLSAEEAGSASGYYEEITLNGTESNVDLFGGIDSEASLVLDGKPSSSLIIKEFYYSGANDPSWATLSKDQYIEIYNNSSEVVYADGLYIASLVPQNNGSDATATVSSLSFEEYVYADKIAQVPGSGSEYPIEAGESIVIAFDAIDWSNGGANDYTVDLSGADFELYAIDWLESQGRLGNSWMDLDNVDVTNMDMIYMNVENYGMFSFLSTGASVAILRCDETPSELIEDPEITTPTYYTKLSVDDIIDGIDMLYDSESAAYKKLPSSVDAGFNYVEGSSYTSLKVRRTVAKTTTDGRIVYKDTNNSSQDFESVHVTE